MRLPAGFLVRRGEDGYSELMPDQAKPYDDPADIAATDRAPSVEAWAERYLDLFQRNWTAWLESTPGMIRSALARMESPAGASDDHGDDG